MTTEHVDIHILDSIFDAFDEGLPVVLGDVQAEGLEESLRSWRLENTLQHMMRVARQCVKASATQDSQQALPFMQEMKESCLYAVEIGHHLDNKTKLPDMLDAWLLKIRRSLPQEEIENKIIQDLHQSLEGLANQISDFARQYQNKPVLRDHGHA